jgi:hypothetical protein
MGRSTKLLLPLALTALFAAMPAGAEVTVSFGVFFDALSPYGDWTPHPRLGMVWSPDVAPGWRPYSVGRWAFAADEGWVWLGDERWAWAPYHYGNWFFDPVRGWLWVPGYDPWAPAVVDWRVTDDWIGWAPRPLSASWIVGPRLLPVHYTFVERRYFAEPLLTRYIVPVDRNVALFSVARPVRVVDVDWIERAAPRRIERVRLRDLEARGGLGPPAGRRLVKAERLQERGRRSVVERPTARGRGFDRVGKLERSTPRRVRELRAAERPGRSRDVLERRGRGREESRVGARQVGRRPAVKRSPPRNAREHRATGRSRGGGGGKGGGKKGGGKPPG